MIDKIRELEKKIDVAESTSFQEDDHYYITFHNHPGSIILIQEKEDMAIIWGYELGWLQNKDVFELIKETFDCKIIVPFVDNDNDIKALKEIGFEECQYYDEDVEPEQLLMPSFVIEKGK